MTRLGANLELIKIVQVLFWFRDLSRRGRFMHFDRKCCKVLELPSESAGSWLLQSRLFQAHGKDSNAYCVAVWYRQSKVVTFGNCLPVELSCSRIVLLYPKFSA